MAQLKLENQTACRDRPMLTKPYPKNQMNCVSPIRRLTRFIPPSLQLVRREEDGANGGRRSRWAGHTPQSGDTSASPDRRRAFDRPWRQPRASPADHRRRLRTSLAGYCRQQRSALARHGRRKAFDWRSPQRLSSLIRTVIEALERTSSAQGSGSSFGISSNGWCVL
ncbi:hypothetical protein EUGRSUZ_E00339 [Eucalyptus grandis]|uniref:Uncharacterized protein n=2 Tax=Eucalyptus grandis TaxID=71139 RepID=A0ACC3KSA6_EUCGR|nr:hypothetical protein EUGRSUZ_E00339 [Eucalyptus grandis]